MSETDFNDQHDLDLLVDGELSERQRSALLARLDKTPDGWRRCALAFLEAQSWQETLGAVVREPEAAEPTITTVVIRDNLRFSTPATLLAMAASFVVAFSLALTLRGGLSGGSDNVQVAESPSNIRRDDTVHHDELVAPAGGSHTDEMALSDPATLAESDDPRAESDDSDPDDQDSEAIDEVPIVLAPWAEGDEGLIPERLVQALQRSGHRVHRRPELLSIELSDGTRGVIPAERIELQYVGNSIQ